MIKRVTMTFNSANEFDNKIMALMRGKKLIIDEKLTATRLKFYIYDFLISEGVKPINSTVETKTYQYDDEPFYDEID